MNLIKQIIKSHRMDLVCFSFEKDDQEHKEELECLGIQVTLVPTREPSLIKKINKIFFSSVPYSAGKYYTKEMEEVIEALRKKNTYDIIHFDHIHMTHYDRLFDGIPFIVDEHNVEYKILERCAGVERFFIKRAIFMDQARKMKEFEQKKVSDLSACSAVSDEDGQILKQLVGGRKLIYTLPNGVDTEYFKKAEVRSEKLEEEENVVVFTGSMDWLPNDDAAVYFCKDILPLIWDKMPEAKFYIVGKAPSIRLKELVGRELRIILTGRVDDVREYVDKSKVFVVPLRIGGGTRLKILEAMAIQKVVVSTKIGAEGIDYTEDENIILADEPKIFADKVLKLLKDKARRTDLEEAGRKLVLQKYDWNIIGVKLEEFYEAVKVK
ncbi:MAG: glycosyltransferase [Candidatus Omnitrophica bacterium]|nr:glycosyltransferase [Candidatus Omnitrophota bacterium]